MIVKAEIINQPYSGEYLERIYDHENPWNSENWTFIKFTKDDDSEFCGQFRGSPIQVVISTINNIILVLTSDYLYQIHGGTGNLIYLEDQPLYRNLTVAPNGDFILADSSNLKKVVTNIHHKTQIVSPIQMDIIEFNKWEDSKLEFTCEEFLNWDKHFVMIYNNETDKIEIKNTI